MSSLEKYLDIKRQADEAQRKEDRAQGALEQLLRELKKDYDCESLEEAKKQVSKLQKELNAKEEELQKSLDSFYKEFPQLGDEE